MPTQRRLQAPQFNNKPLPFPRERAKNSKGKTALHERKPHSPARARINSCKNKPDSKRATKGNGGSRRFVPWCK